MAAQTCTWDNVGGDYNWHNAANWATTVEVDRVPLAGDSVVFNNAVNDNCLLTGDSAANMANLTMTGYTGVLAMATNNLDFNGAVVLDGMITASVGAVLYCSGDFTKTTGMSALPSALEVQLDGTGNVACNSVTGGKLIVNTVGIHTLVSHNYWGGYTQTSGTIIGTGYTMFVNGDVTWVGNSTVTNLTLEQSGTSNLDWDNRVDRIDNYVVAASADITLTGNAWVGTITQDASANIGAGSGMALTVTPGTTPNFAVLAGTVEANVTVEILISNNVANNGIINSDGLLVVKSDAFDSRILTQSGVVNVASLVVKSATNDKYTKLIIGVTGCDLGAITLGTTIGTERTGKLDLGNGAYAVAITSLVAGDNVSNELDFGDAVITLSGALNGQYITCVGEAINGGHAEVHGGTVSNVDLPLDDAALDCTDAVSDGGSNVNVWLPGTPGIHAAFNNGIIGAGAAA